MDIKNMSDLAKVLKSMVEDAMMHEVKDVVTETMQEEIIDEVYAAYEPKVYRRKEFDGGLIDEQNIHATLADWGVNVRNVREDNGRDVAQIVESGEGYKYEWDGMRARPFTEKTREDLKSSGKHIQALKRGLKRNGANVE